MKKSKKLLTVLLSIFFPLLVGYTLFQLSKSRTFQFFGGLTDRVDTNEKVVALTFDDAPSDKTEEILKILADKNVKATFYVIGQNAEQYSEELKKIVSAGNELGNHSYSHERMVLKSPSFVEGEIEKTNQLIREAGYHEEITFRPPNGKKLFALPWYLSSNNIKTIMWDVEPDTYYQGDTQKIISFTLKNTKPGSIILLHPFCESECLADREALGGIIDKLRERGYTFLTVSQILKYKNN